MNAKSTDGVWEDDIRFATELDFSIDLDAFSLADYGHMGAKTASGSECGQWREDCLEPLENGLEAQGTNDACEFSMVE